MVSQINPALPADGVSAVKGDLRQNLTYAKNEIEALQAAQAAFPTSGFTGRRNRLINGNMYHASRGVGSVLVPTTGVAAFHVDRWYGFTVPSGASIRMQRFLASEGITGYPHNSFIRLSTVTAKSPTATDYHLFGQAIEAVMVYDMKWGGGAARPVNVSFLARASIVGTYVLRIVGVNRVYLATFSINQSNTWEPKTVSIPAETTGTFDSSGIGTYMAMQFDLGTGSNRIGTANTWLTDTTLFTVAGAVKMCANNGAFLDVTGVQLEQDTTATPWELPQPILESLVCKRYYQIVQWNLLGYTGVSNALGQFVPFPVDMRANPTLTGSSIILTNCSGAAYSPQTNGVLVTATGTAAGGYGFSGSLAADAEIT